MGRGSGTTRGGNASNPRGLSRSKSEIGMPNESIRSGIGMSRSGAESLQQVRERYNKALDDAVKYYNSAIDEAKLPKAGETMTIDFAPAVYDPISSSQSRLTITKDPDRNITTPTGERIKLNGDYRINGELRASVMSSDKGLREYLKDIVHRNYRKKI